MDQKPKKKKPDPLRNLKWLGYKLAQLPDRYDLKDLVTYARFQLAYRTKTLLKDPIWDTYTVEELLMEFYGLQFMENKEFRIRFEQEIGDVDGTVDEFAAWANKQIAEEAKIRDKVMGEIEDRVVFNPNDVMGDDT